MSQEQIAEKPQTPGRRHCLYIIWLLVIIVFSQALSAEYVDFDEQQTILENRLIKSPLSLQNLINIFTKFESNQYTPLSVASFWIEYNFFGFNSAVSHFINLLLHILAATFCFFLVEELLQKRVAALTVTLFWALHPMQPETVAWVLERRNLLYGMFLLASMCFYIKFMATGSKLFMFFACLTMLLSGTSKTLSFMIPAFWLLVDWIKHYPVDRRLVTAKLPGVIISCFLVFMLFAGAWHWMPHKSGHSLEWNRAFYAMSFYVWKTILPTGLIPTLEENASTVGLFDGAYIYFAAIAGLAVVTGFMVSLRRVFIAGALFYFCNILPLSGVLRVGHGLYAGAHFMYVPLLGLLLSFYAIFDELQRRIRLPKSWQHFLLALILLWFSVISYQHTLIWQNSETLFRHCLEVDPNGLFSRNQLAGYLYRKKLYDEAAQHYRILYETYGKSINGYNGLGIIHFHKQEYEKARFYIEKAVELDPENAIARRNMGLLNRQAGKVGQAEKDFASAVKLGLDDAKTFYLYSEILAHHGRYAQAIKALQRTLEDSAQSFSSKVRLMVLYLESGNYPDGFLTMLEVSSFLRSENFDLETINLLLSSKRFLAIFPYSSLLRYWSGVGGGFRSEG